jgi:hypothetical protein
VTTVGTLLDPIADKLLISAALVSLVDIHRVPAWIVILIIGREFAVSGLRSIAAASGYTIKASELGKTKMASQVVAISLVIAGIRWPPVGQAGLVMMWAVMLFGIISAADYFRKFWRRVDDQVKKRRRRELLRLERQKKRAARQQTGTPLTSRVVRSTRLGRNAARLRQRTSAPGVEAADYINDIFEPCPLDQARGNRTAVAALAMHGNRTVMAERTQHGFQFVQRHQFRAFDVSVIPLRLAPHVDDLEVVHFTA